MGSDNESSNSSFEDRRKMFKSIWDSALAVNAPGAELKKRIYRYIHVEEGDVPKGDAKKERIKHLRAACNKILKICDNQEAKTLIVREEGGYKPHTVESTTDIKTKEQLKEMHLARNKLKRNQPFEIRKNKVRAIPRTSVVMNVVTVNEENPLPRTETVNAWPVVEKELLPDASTSSEDPLAKKKRRMKRRKVTRKMTAFNNITITLPRNSKKPLLKTPADSRSEKIRTVLAGTSGATARVRRVRKKKNLSPLRKLARKVQLSKESDKS